MKPILYLVILIAMAIEVKAQEVDQSCLVLQVESEVMVEGSANVGKFRCFTSPHPPESPLPSCFERSPSHMRITDVEFQIPVEEYSCGNPLVLSDLKKVLESDKHPYIGFKLHELYADDIDGLFYRGNVAATTTVRGQEKEISIPVEVDVLGPEKYMMSGQTSILLSWYGIEQPTRFFGMLKLEDRVDVCFELYFKRTQ